MSILTKLISPKIGVQLLAKMVSDTLKRPVNSFELVCDVKKSTCTFHIEGKKYLAPDSRKLIDIAIDQIKKDAKNSEVDMVILNYSEKEIYFVLAYIENGEKLFKKTIL